MIKTTIGQQRDGRIYHDGQCFNCGRQFMSDFDQLYLVAGFVKFCTKYKCYKAAEKESDRSELSILRPDNIDDAAEAERIANQLLADF